MKIKSKSLVLIIMISLNVFVCAQTNPRLDVPFVPTSHDVVDAMLDMAHVGPADYVIDLGSGDGRIVIAAAKRGALGHGIDLNPVRVADALENAENAGVSDMVVFFEGDLFQADIARASVITMYLLSSVNLKLKPSLFTQLAPGTRIVSHAFSMGRWKADDYISVEGRDVYMWIIPANARGLWEWQTNNTLFQMEVSQEFQNISVSINTQNQILQLVKAMLKGDRISMTAKDNNNDMLYQFCGRIIDGSKITGLVQLRKKGNDTIENWDANLISR